MKTIVMLGGILLLALGVLFMGQGSGWIAWPSSSFMIRQTEWIYYGAAIAVAGIVLMFMARR